MLSADRNGKFPKGEELNPSFAHAGISIPWRQSGVSYVCANTLGMVEWEERSNVACFVADKKC